MSQITCPNCGHTFDPDQKIIHLQKELHFGMDIMIFRRAVYRAWRNSGAAHADHESARISTEEIAAEAGFSAKHCRRGLYILKEEGEVEQVGKKAGWRVTEKIVPFVRSAI